MSCVFRLDAYQIENVAVARNERFDRKLDAHTGDIATSINIAPHAKERTKYRLTLEVQVKPTAQKEKEFFPYFVAVKGRAFFTFNDPCLPEEADRVLRLNGASILYGLLRAQVSQITAQSVYGQFLLPTINFLELAKSQTPSEDAGPAVIRERPTADQVYGGAPSTPSAPSRPEKATRKPARKKATKKAKKAKTKGA